MNLLSLSCILIGPSPDLQTDFLKGDVVNLSNSAICLTVRGDQLLDRSYKQLVQLQETGIKNLSGRGSIK